MGTLGSRIKKLREDLTLTQKELASIIGVERSTLASWETNRREPDYSALQKTAEALNTNIQFLITGEDFPINVQIDKKQADIEGIFKQKDHGDAYSEISAIADKYNLSDEEVTMLIRRVRETYGPLPTPVIDSKAAHGPSYPGSGAFTKEDMEEKDDKGNDGQNPASKPNSRRSKNKNKI